MYSDGALMGAGSLCAAINIAGDYVEGFISFLQSTMIFLQRRKRTLPNAN